MHFYSKVTQILLKTNPYKVKNVSNYPRKVQQAIMKTKNPIINSKLDQWQREFEEKTESFILIREASNFSELYTSTCSYVFSYL